MKKPKADPILLSIADFPNAIEVRMENSWITVVLSNCRVKFKNWVSHEDLSSSKINTQLSSVKQLDGART